MFIQAIIVAIIIGYILRGSLKNFELVELKGLYAVTLSFTLQFIVIMLIRKGMLHNGTLTLVLHLIMYILLFYFIYLNRKYKFLVLMGVGFLLNAIPIFLNGGSMPVSHEAVVKLGANMNVTKMGLYNFINSNTRVWFLGDIFPYKAIIKVVMSIGDIIIVIGLMLFIITGMKNKENFNHIESSNVVDKII